MDKSMDKKEPGISSIYSATRHHNGTLPCLTCCVYLLCLFFKKYDDDIYQQFHRISDVSRVLFRFAVLAGSSQSKSLFTKSLISPPVQHQHIKQGMRVAVGG